MFFPGGDIGRLAVCGTVNDLAMVGAQPLGLTAGFILEEGLLIATLQSVIESMRLAAEEAGIRIVAGDTKVVERGKGDGVFINTSGLGWVPVGREISGRNAQAGDVVLLTGPIGDHGIAVLTARGGLALETDVRSDVAPLNRLVEALLSAFPEVHVLRDPTRGGVATALNEIARQSGVAIQLDETAIPVEPIGRIGLRAARAGSAVRGQRGQGADRAARGPCPGRAAAVALSTLWRRLGADRCGA